MCVCKVLIITVGLNLHMLYVAGVCEVGQDQSLIGSLFTHNQPACSDVQLQRERLICRVDNQEDLRAIVNHVKSDCQSEHCTDFGVSRICQPLMTMNTLQYKCHCLNPWITPPAVPASHWTDWQKLQKPFREFPYSRQLVLTEDTSVCLAEEFHRRQARYIMHHYQLVDIDMSASSEIAHYKVEFVRYDPEAECGWSSGNGDKNPWVQFILPDEYVVIGVLIRKSCNNNDRPDRVEVSGSKDGITWNDIVSRDDMRSTQYGKGSKGAATVMFPEPYTARHWKLAVKGQGSFTEMFCDLIGFTV